MVTKDNPTNEKDINNYADREKIELCREALIYAIAFFRGYNRDHTNYPVMLLDDLKDLLEDLLREGVLNGI
jgi:hypothetical protein